MIQVKIFYLKVKCKMKKAQHYDTDTERRMNAIIAILPVQADRDAMEKQGFWIIVKAYTGIIKAERR